MGEGSNKPKDASGVSSPHDPMQWPLAAMKFATDAMFWWLEQAGERKAPDDGPPLPWTTPNKVALELTTKSGQDATGTLALPFGLALAKGVTLEIDDQKLEGSLQFNTCQAVGCLVPVTFNADTTPLLQNGTTLKINATAADTAQPIVFTISLNGFAGALARTADLSAD